MSKITFTTQEYYAGETIVPPATTPTKSGYTFREWTGFPANMIMPAENITVTAEFDEASSPITFASNNIKNVCVTQWGSDGEITEAQAAAVTTFNDSNYVNYFYNVSGSFNEMQYFTGVTSIGVNKTSSFNKITSVTIPDNITQINGYCFGDRINASGPSITVNFVTPRTNNFSIGTNGFRGVWRTSTPCENVINLPETLANIGAYAFADNEITGTFVVPASVTWMGGYVWYKSLSGKYQTLDYIKFLGTTPPSVNQYAFMASASNANAMIRVLIPESALSAYQSAWSNLFSNSKFKYSTY